MGEVRFCSKHGCKMIYSPYSFDWYCRKCVEETFEDWQKEDIAGEVDDESKAGV